MTVSQFIVYIGKIYFERKRGRERERASERARERMEERRTFKECIGRAHSTCKPCPFVLFRKNSSVPIRINYA